MSVGDLVEVCMEYQLGHKGFARSRRLIILCCALLYLTPADFSRAPALAATTTVALSNCKECERPPAACPLLTVSCPDDVETDKPITFVSNVSGVEPETKT